MNMCIVCGKMTEEPVCTCGTQPDIYGRLKEVFTIPLIDWGNVKKDQVRGDLSWQKKDLKKQKQ